MNVAKRIGVETHEHRWQDGKITSYQYLGDCRELEPTPMISGRMASVFTSCASARQNLHTNCIGHGFVDGALVACPCACHART